MVDYIVMTLTMFSFYKNVLIKITNFTKLNFDILRRTNYLCHNSNIKSDFYEIFTIDRNILYGTFSSQIKCLLD